MRWMVVPAAVIAWPAMAQTEVPRPRLDGHEIYSPGMRIEPTPPSEEAMALGRRLALLLDRRAVAERIGELLREAGAVEAPPPPMQPGGFLRPYASIPRLKNPGWGLELQGRVVDHVAYAYARRYSLDELEQLAVFFETAAGQRYLDERRGAAPADVAEALRHPHLDEDLREVVCRAPAPSGPVDGPNHGYVRIYPNEPGGEAGRLAWCDAPVRKARD